MTDARPFNVMLDPSSVLVDEWTFEETLREIRDLREEYTWSNVFVPDTLRRLVESPGVSEETTRRFIEFYVPPDELEYVVPLDTVVSRLSSEAMFFATDQDHRERYPEFYRNVEEEFPEEAEQEIRAIAPAIFEEWVFLQE